MTALETAIYLALAGDATLAASLPGASHLVTVTATGGTFTLTFSGATTAAIAYNATAAAVQAAIAALATVGTGNVLATGAAGGPFTVTFTGTLATTALALTGSGASLTGEGAALAIAQRAAVYNVVAVNPPAKYMRFAKVSSVVEHSLKVRLSEDYRYQFTVIAPGPSAATINAAVARLEALFDRVALSVSGETFWLGEKVGDNPTIAEEIGGALWLAGGADCRFILGG